MENEIWLPIATPVNLEGKYEISNLGRLKRCGYFKKIDKKWKPDLIVKLFTNTKYMKVRLPYMGGYVNVSVHRLVCCAFHKNDDNKPQVNHKDGNKHNNKADNLEWATQSENIRHAQSIGIMKYAKPKIKLPRKKKRPVYKKVIDLSTKIVYNSPQEAAAVAGITLRNMRRSLSGERINRTNFRYIDKNGVINNNVILPRLKVIKEKPVKLPRIPKPPYMPHPLPTKAVKMIDINDNIIQVFKSTREAATFIETKLPTFRKWLRTTNTGYHKGFIFKYA